LLIRQTFAYLPAQLLSPLTQLAAALLLTHALGAADYGLVMLIFAAQELVFLACLSWWTTFYLRFGSRFVPAHDPLALTSTEAAVLLWSAAAQVAVTVAIIVATEPGLSPAFYAAACAFTLTRSLLNFLGERARRVAAIGSYTAVQVAGPLGGLALVGVLMWAQATSPAAVLAAFALTQGLVGLAVAARFGLLVRPRKLDHAVLAEARRFGAPVVLANMLSWLGGNAIRFVVHHGAGPVALGLMSVGWGLATRLSGVAAMLVAAAAYPLAVKQMEAGDAAGARGQLAANSSLLLLMLAPAGLAFWALAPLLVPWLVAAEYQAATLQILPWALLGACVRNLRLHGWDQTYLLFAATRDMVLLDVVEAVVMTLAAAVGLWWGGVVGAVAASAWAAIGLAVLDAWWLHRRFGLVLPLGTYLRVLVAAAAMALLLHALLPWLTASDIAALLPAAAAGGLVYLLALALLFPGQVVRVFGWVRHRRSHAIRGDSPPSA
jgi:O-antigen/teichoic acid export membrane protein